MKIKLTTHEIDLNDPQNFAIREAKDKADGVMEWAVMFHQGSLAIAVLSIVVAIFGSTEQWLVSLGFWLVLFVISHLLRAHAKAIVMVAIHRSMDDE